MPVARDLQALKKGMVNIMKDSYKSYDDRAHFIGRISLIVGYAGMLLFPLALIFCFGIKVPVKEVASGIFQIILLMLPVSISEFFSIAPMIGSSAMYIMVLTGNFTNLKIPSSVAAMESVGLDPTDYTEESDIISTIAMATSTIVSEIIILLGVLLLIPLSGILSSQTLAPAFENIVPALFGALGAGMISKHLKIAIVPFVMGILLLSFKWFPSALVMPVLVLFGVITTRILYKKNLLKN